MQDTREKLKLETLLLHGGATTRKAGGAAEPICQSTAFAYETAEELEAVFAGNAPGFVYSRIANPTVMQFERRMAALEGGLGAVACSSGMAAISSTVLALVGAGGEVVAGNSVFGGTYSLFRDTLTRCGITTRFVAAGDPAAYRAAVNERTRLIFLESIGNPKLDVPDIAAIAGIAREHAVVLAVDNTAATPCLFQPRQAGADIVIHSASKFINGHGNSIGGVIVDCGTFDWSGPRYAHLDAFHRRAGSLAFLACLRGRICRDTGCCLSPFNAFLMSVGLESLAVRMQRHCDNAARAAAFLAQHPGARDVRYPGLANHPDHATARRLFRGGYGGLLTFKLESRDRCFRFINGLRLAANTANLGAAATLVIHPASTFCREFDAAEQAALGVTDDLIRLSIGLEHIDDILEDLETGLRQL